MLGLFALPRSISSWSAFGLVSRTCVHPLVRRLCDLPPVFHQRRPHCVVPRHVVWMPGGASPPGLVELFSIHRLCDGPGGFYNVVGLSLLERPCCGHRRPRVATRSLLRNRVPQPRRRAIHRADRGSGSGLLRACRPNVRGIGQVLGRAFEAYPSRMPGYTINIAGSLVGIIAFSGISFLQAPPTVWFAVCCTGIAYLLHQAGSL